MIDMIFESHNIRDTILTLLEGIAKARDLYQNKYKTPMPKEVERALTRMNPKYAEWVIRVDQDANLADQMPYKENLYTRALRQFADVVARGIIKGADADINQYKTFDQLINRLKDVEHIRTKSAVEREAKVTGSDLVWSNPNGSIKIVKILSHKASCYYGHDTKWCVSMRDNPEDWEGYYASLDTFYFILNNTLPVEHVYNKVAVLVEETGEIKAYDKTDLRIGSTHFSKYLANYGIPRNIFKPLKTTKDTLKEVLSRLGVENYKIRPNGKVDVEGNVNATSYVTQLLKIKFGRVTGEFSCSYSGLTTLQGLGIPEIVGGNFRCNNNHLTTLEGSPKTVGGFFDCSCNKLISLRGSPKTVGGNFLCDVNQLKTLKEAPELVGGNFYCRGNPLKSPVQLPTNVKGALFA
jgi:hypothetical protein